MTLSMSLGLLALLSPFLSLSLSLSVVKLVHSTDLALSLSLFLSLAVWHLVKLIQKAASSWEFRVLQQQADWSCCGSGSDSCCTQSQSQFLPPQHVAHLPDQRPFLPLLLFDSDSDLETDSDSDSDFDSVVVDSNSDSVSVSFSLAFPFFASVSVSGSFSVSLLGLASLLLHMQILISVTFFDVHQTDILHFRQQQTLQKYFFSPSKFSPHTLEKKLNAKNSKWNYENGLEIFRKCFSYFKNFLLSFHFPLF